VKVLCSDNGGEYKSRLLADYLKEERVIHQTTVPENPAQNGMAERMNRIIVETVRSMMCHSKFFKSSGLKQSTQQSIFKTVAQ